MITYSSLISACEKSGEWRLALQFFEECLKDGCRPNVITFNSLITACAQGARPAPGVCRADVPSDTVKSLPNVITLNPFVTAARPCLVHVTVLLTICVVI